MSIKVLVADDSITIQKVIGIIFSGDEYSLTVVDNGKTAVDKAREINPDILLIDALMPGMTGYEVAEVVRSTPALAAKPILILTGSFEPFDEDKAKKCGADDFIAKPFESQQILAKVKELLELGATRGTTMAAQAPPQPAVEPVSVQAPPVAPVFDVPAPAPVAPPVTEQPAEAPADIWGAFTAPEPAPVVEPSAAFSAPAAAVAEPAAFEPDVFAIVSEENDSQLIPSAAPVTETAPSHTGSQWVPVEENTFEFEDTADEPAAPVQEVSMPEASFGDISFEDDVTEPVAQPDFTEPVAAVLPEPAVPEAAFADFAAPSAAPAFEAFEVPAAPVEPFAPLADPAPVATVAAPVAVAPASAATLTEDQLKQALASVSKDVIERIVWEVVPDLAEALIREAIRKIKEGN
jgi:CheY-like chemotaxis protein